MDFLASPWIPCMLLLVLAWGSRRVEGSWASPGAFFAGYWAAFTAVPLLAAPEYRVEPVGVWWIFAATFSLTLGSALGGMMGRGPQRTLKVSRGAAPRVRRLVLVSAALGMGVVVLHLASFGFDLSVFRSIGSLMDVGRSISVARYHEQYSGSLLSSVLLIPMYLSALVGGVLYQVSKSPKSRAVSFVPFVPALCVTFVLTTKAALLYSGLLWASGWLTAAIALWIPVRITSPKSLIAGVGMMVVVGTIFVFSSLSRYGMHIEAESVAFVLNRMKVYPLGHVGGLSIWLDDYATADESYALGVRTMAGIANLTGLAERQQGVFVTFVRLAPDVYTNIYTFHRGILEDFGFIGAIILMLLTGICSSQSFHRLRSGNLLFLGPLALFYSFTFWSFTISLLSYNSMMIVFIVFTVMAGFPALFLGLRTQQQPNDPRRPQFSLF